MTLTPSPQSVAGHTEVPDPDTLRKLRWRCRRGLLENDLFIEIDGTKGALVLIN